ncbi:MAG: formylglycine-generating enzyme family protein [Anaerolineae bacterium]|jgi:serine/threonine-protein kinase
MRGLPTGHKLALATLLVSILACTAACQNFGRDLLGVTRNPAMPAATRTRPADGAAMVSVPAGTFLMGSTNGDPGAGDNEKPRHTVYLDAFWIDESEVTNAQYRRCVEAGACQQPGCWEDDLRSAPDQPVVCVTWHAAQAYAAWAGGRLPTEAEWEKAARGTDGRTYPWGNSPPDCIRANYLGCLGKANAVGSYAPGASPYGALDMAGNVWEWVADPYDPQYYTLWPQRNPQGPDAGDRRTVRGGGFSDDPQVIRCAYRGGGSPNYWGTDVGFRVAMNAPP